MTNLKSKCCGADVMIMQTTETTNPYSCTKCKRMFCEVVQQEENRISVKCPLFQVIGAGECFRYEGDNGTCETACKSSCNPKTGNILVSPTKPMMLEIDEKLLGAVIVANITSCQTRNEEGLCGKCRECYDLAHIIAKGTIQNIFIPPTNPMVEVEGVVEDLEEVYKKYGASNSINRHLWVAQEETLKLITKYKQLLERSRNEKE